jgi:hypothetical protein
MNNTTELKLDYINWQNEKRQLEERNNKAIEYSRKVSRKNRERKENIELLLAPFGIAAIGYTMFQITMHLCVLIGGVM